MRTRIAVTAMAISGCLLLFILVVAEPFNNYRKAEAMLNELRNIRPGETKAEQLRPLVRRGLLTPEKDCSTERCTYQFWYRNRRWLAQLHLGNGSDFAGKIQVKDGVVDYTVAALSIVDKRWSVTIHRDPCFSCSNREEPKSYGFGFNVTGLGQAQYAAVFLSRDAPQQVVDEAYDINLRVLREIGAIKSGRELAARLWAARAPGYR